MKFIALTSLVLSAYSAYATATPVVITAHSSHAIQPSSSDLQYDIACPAHRYKLAINYERDEILWHLDGERIDSSLPTTPLGELLISRQLYGRFGFACVAQGISLTFLGFHLDTAANVQPVEYLAVIGNDGSVLMSTKLEPTTLRFIQQVWSKQASGKTQSHR